MFSKLPQNEGTGKYFYPYQDIKTFMPYILLGPLCNFKYTFRINEF